VLTGPEQIDLYVQGKVSFLEGGKHADSAIVKRRTAKGTIVHYAVMIANCASEAQVMQAAVELDDCILRAHCEPVKVIASPTLTTAADRRIWFDGYVRTYLERDLQDLAAISGLPDFRRLMRAACLRMGQIINQTELGRDVALPQPTVHRWLNLLETSCLLVSLSASAVNRTKRLIKAPKIYWGDTGIAMHLAQTEEPAGTHLENLVLHDLLAWRDARIERAELGYRRTSIGEAVDFVVEAAGKRLPIEVKSTARPRLSDAAHLRTFRAEYGKEPRAGLLLHTGNAIGWLAPDVLAAPWGTVL